MLPSKPLRSAVALCLSVVLHFVVAAVMMGSQLAKLWPRSPAVEIEVVTTPPKALPLGDPAPAAAPPPPRPVAEAPRAPKKKRVPLTPPQDAGADAGEALDATAPQLAELPQGLRPDGPEGARLVVRLRLDRLRDAPRSHAFMSLTDSLLQLLPDRRRLLEGSGLDLFADFDSLIVATPNPLDDAVTFLAVRHHLSDEALMTALGRAATGAGRPIEWTQKRGRPVGLRPTQSVRTRDDRLFVLPEPGWAVIAPQAYMALLLPELGPAEAGAPAVQPESFATLAARVRGEDMATPANAVLSATMADMLSNKPGQALTLPGAGPLAVPKRVAVAVSLQPQPELQIRLGFAERSEASQWARVLPDLRRQYAGHPLVALGGMSAVIGRVTVEQRPAANADVGGDVVIQAPMTPLEAERILTLVGNILRGQLAQ